jgi:hypothetical protein
MEPGPARVHPMLLRLAIGLACVLVVWEMSVPDFDRGARPRANESAAITTLRNIAAAEQQFRSQHAIDLDGDGRGEAGFLGELAGVRPLRAPAGVSASALATPLLSAAFGVLEHGRVHRSGYFFMLYLPTADGCWLREGRSGAVDADACEQRYLVYAWPDGTDAGSRRSFLLDGADIWASRSDDSRYAGTAAAVPVDAALPASEAGTAAAAGVRIGRDGRPWVLLR